MKGYIYGLKDPITKIIVYIGATKEYPTKRFVEHYRQLEEVLKGKRNNTKKFEYMKKLLPLKLILTIIEEVDIINLYNKEEYYINEYRKLNPELLNETVGGIGGNTHIYKDNKNIQNIGIKISNALKGKKKPKGFAENLSNNRKGCLNPGSKRFNSPVFCTDSANNVIAEFNYSFEIDKWLNKQAWSNISRAINNPNRKCYGYYWKK